MKARMPLVLVAALIAGCSRTPPTENSTATPLSHAQAQERFWSVPWVQKKAKEIRRLSNEQVRAVTADEGEETRSGRAYYAIRFAESHDTHIVTLAFAFVDKQTGEVFFQDPITFDLLTPEQWLQWVEEPDEPQTAPATSSRPASFGLGAFVTPSYVISITDPHREGCVSCDQLVIHLRSRATGKAVTLTGSTMHSLGDDGVTPARFKGYTFTVGDITYVINASNVLEISRGDSEVLLEEKDELK